MAFKADQQIKDHRRGGGEGLLRIVQPGGSGILKGMFLYPHSREEEIVNLVHPDFLMSRELT